MTLDISWGRFKITRNFLHRTEYSTGLWMVSFLCYFKLIKCQHLPLILFQDLQAIGNLNPNTARELTAFEHQRQVSSDTTSILMYNSSIGTVGQPPAPQASGQYWTTSPSTDHNSLNLHTLPSEAQVQCSSLVQGLMDYFNNPVDSPLMLFPSRYTFYQSNPIIAGMVPHMVHIATWFALVGPARNYLQAGDPLQQGMLTRIARTAMSLVRSAHAVNYPTVQPEAGKLNKKCYII